MTELHIFMEIDTCPMCGDEIYVVENEHSGKKLEDIPVAAVFEIVCRHPNHPRGTVLTCGKFVIKKRDVDSIENDWFAEDIPVPRDW